jgi:hypothetical protein
MWLNRTDSPLFRIQLLIHVNAAPTDYINAYSKMQTSIITSKPSCSNYQKVNSLMPGCFYLLDAAELLMTSKCKSPKKKHLEPSDNMHRE